MHTESDPYCDLESARPKLRLSSAPKSPSPPPPPLTPPPAPTCRAEDTPTIAAAPPAPDPIVEALTKSVSKVSDMLDAAAAGEARYTQLEYTATFWRYWLNDVTNWIIVGLSCGLLMPLARARSNALHFRSIRIAEEGFEYQVKAGKACLLFTAFAAAFVVSIGLAIQQPFAHANYAALASGIAAAAILPLFMRELIRAEIEALSFRSVPFRFTGTNAGAFQIYMLAPAVILGIGIGINFLLDSNRAGYLCTFLLTAILQLHIAYKLKQIEFGARQLRFKGPAVGEQDARKQITLIFIGLQALLAGAAYALFHFNLVALHEVASLVAAETLQQAASLTVAAIVLFFALAQFTLLLWFNLALKIKTRSSYLDRIDIDGARLLDAYRIRSFFTLKLTNALFVILSAGLLAPLARLRQNRYFVENVALIGDASTLDKICKAAKTAR